MCGIIGYLGPRKAVDVIIDSLKRLEYRGYDSAGIAIHNGKKISIIKRKGKISDLEEKIKENPLPGNLGIGHTRWATHGKPNDINAHPHKVGRIVLVHNGIIENYKRLKEKLTKEGIEFYSETDTEVITALINYYYKGNIIETLMKAIGELEGSLAIALITEESDNLLVGYRKDSPLILGVGDGEMFLASDMPALLPYTRRFIPLDDEELVVIEGKDYRIMREGKVINKKITVVNWDPISAEKGGFKHFMLKEIFEQPRAIGDTIRGMYSFEDRDFYVFKDNNNFDLTKLSNIRKIMLVACGTSYHACLTSKYWFESLARIEVETEIASEFRYRDLLNLDGTLAIFVSQSGETIDTLQAMRMAKKKRAITLGIVNVIGSTIAREADIVTYTHAGPEIGVASTKAFTSQLAVLFILTLYLSK
ncbi:MAG: glutamine--fructose-6-phosphate transaminase (isomerizing), partial [Thermosulfidibacteraceae bacterium]